MTGIKRFFAGLMLMVLLAGVFPQSAFAASSSSSAQEETFDLQAWIDYAAPYYRIDPDFEPESSPLTEESLIENIRWCFFTGDYDLGFTYTEKEDALRMLELIDLQRLAALYPELLGFYCNSGYDLEILENEAGIFVLSLYVPDAPLTPEELFARQREGLEAALAFSEKLHKRRIKSTMSEKEIAEVYFTQLCRLGVEPSGINPETANHQIYMQYDSVYATLVEKSSDCVGRAAAFNLLMNIEGISSAGVSGRFKFVRTSHLISLLTLDGKEYVCDWGNQLAIQTVAAYSRMFYFDKTSLADARALLAA